MSLEQVLCKIDFLMVKSSSGKHSFSPSEELDATESCKQAQLFRRKCYNHYSVYYNLTFNKKRSNRVRYFFSNFKLERKVFLYRCDQTDWHKRGLVKVIVSFPSFNPPLSFDRVSWNIIEAISSGNKSCISAQLQHMCRFP